jgi:hypothetical protein
MLRNVTTSPAFSAAALELISDGTATAASMITMEITITASISENPF